MTAIIPSETALEITADAMQLFLDCLEEKNTASLSYQATDSDQLIMARDAFYSALRINSLNTGDNNE